MKLTLVVRADLGLGRGKIVAQAAHAAVVSALANLCTPDFRAWLRDGSLPPRPGPHRLPNPQLSGYTQTTNSNHHIAWPRERRGRGEESTNTSTARVLPSRSRRRISRGSPSQRL
jgi:hypothetical protein